MAPSQPQKQQQQEEEKSQRPQEEAKQPQEEEEKKQPLAEEEEETLHEEEKQPDEEEQQQQQSQEEEKQPQAEEEQPEEKARRKAAQAAKRRARDDIATRGAFSKVYVIEADLDEEEVNEKCRRFYPKQYQWSMMFQESVYPTCEHCIHEWREPAADQTAEAPRKKELLRCNRCKVAHYCCAEHQKADWGVKHKYLCKDLVERSKDRSTPFVLRKLKEYVAGHAPEDLPLFFRAPRRFVIVTSQDVSSITEDFLRPADVGCAFVLKQEEEEGKQLLPEADSEEEEEGEKADVPKKKGVDSKSTLAARQKLLFQMIGCLCRDNCGWPCIVTVCSAVTGYAVHFVPTVRKDCPHDPRAILREAGKEAKRLTDEDLENEMRLAAQRLKELQSMRLQIRTEAMNLHARLDTLARMRKKLKATDMKAAATAAGRSDEICMKAAAAAAGPSGEKK